MLKKREVIDLLIAKEVVSTIKEGEELFATIDTVIDVVGEGLEVGDKAKVGKLELAKVKKDAYKARNPKTGESIDVAEKIVVKSKIK